MNEKSMKKTWTLRFPANENPNMEKDYSIGQSIIVLQYAVKAKYRLSFGKFSGMKFFTQASA